MRTAWWRGETAVWNADGWTLELRGDELADIRRGGDVLIRAVRAVVRDHGWQTVPVSVVSRAASDTALTLTLRHSGLGADILSTLTVNTAHDDLRIEWSAENVEDFDTCRTGLVLLHPAAAAGSTVAVTHWTGSLEQTVFPESISPHQPIFDIRTLDIDEPSGPTTIRFEGDVFEMEDQRNWSDASFKTYTRPLALPYPYRLLAGERLRQAITITSALEAAPTQRKEVRSGGRERARAEIELVEADAFPLVGVEASTAPDPVPSADDGLFRIVELDLRTPTWRAALSRAAADGLPLDVRLVTDQAAQTLADAARALVGHPVIAVTPFDSSLHISDHATITRTRAALEAAGVSAALRGGARSHFTEYNREHARIPPDISGVVITTSPMFHSVETEQLVESLPMQRLIVTQATAMAAHPVHVGPVSLRPRFNNVATTAQPAPTRSDLRDGYGAQFTGGVDARQDAAELAAWTIASAAALAVPGVASLAWFETAGPRGLRDSSGRARPASEAVAALVALHGGTLLWGDSPDGRVWALGVSRDGQREVLVANLDRVRRSIRVSVPGASMESTLEAGRWRRLTSSR